MKSRLVLASLLSVVLHLVVLLGLHTLSPFKSRPPMAIGMAPATGPAVSIRLLPMMPPLAPTPAPPQALQEPVVQATRTFRAALQSRNAKQPEQPARPALARQAPAPSASPSAAISAPTAPAAPIAASAPTAASATTSAPTPHANTPGPSDTTRNDAISTTLSAFARGHAKALAAQTVSAPPSPPGAEATHRRNIDRLYAKAGKGSQQGWEEYRGQNGTSVIRFAAGTCTRITDPPDHEHRHLNKTIQAVGCPD